MMRHILGVLGVLAALVLLVVSAMMNYQFGYNYGRTPTDGLIYGMASAAADCFKALTPFFFFAALRNRVWSQALAAALVWVVVTVYAFMSALGHASTNRSQVNGERVVASINFKDLRDDRKRLVEEHENLKKKLDWIPPHRPTELVKAEIRMQEAKTAWITTKGCTDITLRASREFCQKYGELKVELAAGEDYRKLDVRMAEVGARIVRIDAQTKNATGVAVVGAADPQANLISRLTGYDVESVQTGLMLFVALLIEIGSGFGLYVAFAYWRPNQSLHGDHSPQPRTAEAQPARREEKPEATEERKDEREPTAKADPIWTAEHAADAADARSGPPPPRPFGDNDNKSAPKRIMPEDDVEMFYKQGVRLAEGEFIVSQDLYDGYKLWAKKKERRPLNHSHFSKNFEKLGYKTVQIGGRQRYVGITLTPDLIGELEKKGARRPKSVLGQGAPQEPSQELTKASMEAAYDETTAASDKLRATAEEMRQSLEPRPQAAASGKAARAA